MTFETTWVPWRLEEKPEREGTTLRFIHWSATAAEVRVCRHGLVSHTTVVGPKDVEAWPDGSEHHENRDAFKELLYACFETQAQAATALRVDESTVRRWLSGARTIPGPAWAYLDLYLTTKE